ncbi:MAG: DUF2493 domain-containing protein [Clostridia bacterium]|nr:DUF2493 domain-containing protein [Clostridia bacterium]
MKVAIIGSRNLKVANLGKFLPPETTEIVSGGARGIDQCARRYALAHGIKLTEFLPDYESYGRGAPLRRNIQIIDYSDLVLAFWDGSSHGTRFVIEKCKERNTHVRVFLQK